MNLTARSYAWAIAVCVLGIAAQWTEAVPVEFWRILAAAGIVLLVVEGILIRRDRVDVSRELPNRVALGQTISGALMIANPAPRPMGIELRQVYPDAIEGTDSIRRVDIAPQNRASQPFNAVATNLGQAVWPVIHARLLGRFGLGLWNRVLRVATTTEVVPDHLQDHERNVGTRASGDLVQTRAGAGGELIGLREYQPGDPVRRIDWKATARATKPMVRIFAEERELELLLAIDVGRTSGVQAGSLTRLGHYANIAARLAEAAARDGSRVGIVTFAEQPIEVMALSKGGAGLRQLRNVLARMQVVPRESNPLSAMLELRRLAPHRALIAILTGLEETDAAGQLARAVTLAARKHLPLIGAMIDPELIALRERTPTRWLDPHELLAAQQELFNLRRVELQLRRQGAHVVVAPPDLLDREMRRRYYELYRRRQV